MTTTYIGYTTLEDFEQAMKKKYSVHADIVSEIRPTETPGYVIENFIIIVSVAVKDDVRDEVHYCRILAGSVQNLNGNRLGKSSREIEEKANVNYEKVCYWLRSNGLHTKKGVISMPIGLQKLEGVAGVLLDEKNG